MPEPSSAERLRQAAQLLRERSGLAATPYDPTEPWYVLEDDADENAPYVAAGPEHFQAYIAEGILSVDHARWIAAMGPRLAEPLATWLEREAVRVEVTMASAHAAIKRHPKLYGSDRVVVVVRANHGAALAVADVILDDQEGPHRG